MDTKPALKSLTTWGLILFGAIQAAQVAGAIPDGGAEAASKWGEAISLAIAYYGRWRATQPLSIS